MGYSWCFTILIGDKGSTIKPQSQKIEKRGSKDRLGNPELRVLPLSQTIPAEGRCEKTPGRGGGRRGDSFKTHGIKALVKMETQNRGAMKNKSETPSNRSEAPPIPGNEQPVPERNPPTPPDARLVGRLHTFFHGGHRGLPGEDGVERRVRGGSSGDAESRCSARHTETGV